MKIEDCIFFMLARANQAGARYWTSCLVDLNLTAVQAMVLNFLGWEDKSTAKEISEQTGLDSATLTGVLDRLEASGFIERRPHQTDRRAIHICLTSSGRNVIPSIRKKMDTANREFLSALSDKEKNQLRRLLQSVRYATTAP